MTGCAHVVTWCFQLGLPVVVVGPGNQRQEVRIRLLMILVPILIPTMVMAVMAVMAVMERLPLIHLIHHHNQQVHLQDKICFALPTPDLVTLPTSLKKSNPKLVPVPSYLDDRADSLLR